MGREVDHKLDELLPSLHQEKLHQLLIPKYHQEF